MPLANTLRWGALTVPLALAATVTAQEQEELEEIIVTGEKIERSLQDTTSSVAVYDEFTILQQNFTDLYDVINQTANVTSIFDDAGFTIRGLRNSGASPGDQTSDVSTVYLDGVFIPSGLFTSNGLSLWDIDSVEIFRGPQSTIQGRNALAGAIVARTVDPGNEFEGATQLRYGEFGQLRASGAVTVPLVEDQASLRFAVDYLEDDGFNDNTFLGTDDGDRSDGTTARAKLLLTPEGIPELTARLNLTFIDSEDGENRIIESLFPQRISQQNIETRDSTDAFLGSLELSYDLSEQLSITSVTAYQDSENAFRFDPDNEPFGSTEPGFTDTDNEVRSQELRLTYDGDRLDAIVGAYAFDSTSAFVNSTAFPVGTEFAFPDPVTLAGLLFMTPAPTPAQIAQATFIRSNIVMLVPEFDVAFDRAASDEIRNYAIFGEATWSLSDRLRLTLGARYDREDIDQDVFDGTTVPPLPQVGDPLIDGVLNALAAQFTNIVELEANNDFSAFLPKASINYDWTDDLSTAFTVQRAYRAGGLSFNIFRAALPVPGGGDPNDQSVLEEAGVVNSFDPEFTWNYELALRSQWLDRRLTVNGNLFWIDYDDQQINIQLSSNPLDSLTDNVGKSRMYGFELETVATLSDEWEIFANLGFTDTEFEEAGNTVGDVDLTGLEFSYAPRWTAGLGGRYQHANGFFANVRTRYTDESFSLPANDPTGVNDSLFIVDLLAGYETDRYTIELFVNNALDEEYLTFNPADPNSGAITIAGDPRVYGVRFLTSF
ncbi:MAG: TonB-dependent receptor [Pseudomonadota bacterium]